MPKHQGHVALDIVPISKAGVVNAGVECIFCGLQVKVKSGESWKRCQQLNELPLHYQRPRYTQRLTLP